jgi:hypothetical protein
MKALRMKRGMRMRRLMHAALIILDKGEIRRRA